MKPKLAALALALAAVAGCNLNRPEPRRATLFDQLRVGGGQVIAPKRCVLTTMVVARPMKDAVIDQAVWRAADEQVIPPETRHVLEANGLRVGVIVGAMPLEVEALLNAPPPNKVDPMTAVIPDGHMSLVTPCAATKGQTSLLLNQQGKAVGKVYDDAVGVLRVTACHEGTTGVALRIVPELHFGPIQHRFEADPNAAPFSTQQFVTKDGQAEETLRDLAATLTLQPGQALVIGCRPELPHSLGNLLLTEAEVGSDRLLQKVVFLWAGRNSDPADSKAPIAPANLVPLDPKDPAAPGTDPAKVGSGWPGRPAPR